MRGVARQTRPIIKGLEARAGVASNDTQPLACVLRDLAVLGLFLAFKFAKWNFWYQPTLGTGTDICARSAPFPSTLADTTIRSTTASEIEQ